MKRRPPPVEPPAGPFNPALAGLAALRASLPGADAPATRAPAERDAPSPGLAGVAGKVVVSRERKGHGGKTMVRVAGLALPAGELEAVAGRMRKGLGCGARVEAADILVQGDQAERVASWLAEAGVRKVIIGN